MSSLNYEQVLQNFTYKPNFIFKVLSYPRPTSDYDMLIGMFVEDSRKPTRPWELAQVGFRDNFDLLDYEWGQITRNATVAPPRAVIRVDGQFPIPRAFGPGDDKQFISWLVYQIRSMETHEIDEWVRYKGELLRDPHKES